MLYYIVLCHIILNYVITSLATEVVFLLRWFVWLSVCLSVDKITQKVMNGLGCEILWSCPV